MERSRPNILVTGTPGTGKTSLCEAIASATGYNHINIGTWVKDKGLHSGWDEEFDCHILDEDKVLQVTGIDTPYPHANFSSKILIRAPCLYGFLILSHHHGHHWRPYNPYSFGFI